jgi:pseudaminic acid biosynthesis-associated methylase
VIDQIDKWKGEFGDDYTDRNAITVEHIEARMQFWLSLFNVYGVPGSILEIGAGNGQNIMAINNSIQIIAQKAPVENLALLAVEPNKKARENLESGCPYLNVFDGDIYKLPFETNVVQLVFTSGVLIHIPPDKLDLAISEMYRVSAKYILCMEYFAPKCEEIVYRGEDGMLWRNDYGGLFLDKYRLRVAGYGFCWKRITKLDNLTWWLLEKTH